MITIFLINDADLGKSISSSVFHFGNVGVTISASQIKIITRFISSSTQEGSRTATADPDNTGRGYNDIIGDLGDHSVKVGCNDRSSMKREMFLARPFNGRNPKTLTMPSRVMVMSPQIPPTLRKSSSIIVTTSAAPLISPTPRATSPSLMLTCRMANCLWMNTHPRRICRISSTARNSTKRRDYTTMVRGI